jgi:hypothetical protein
MKSTITVANGGKSEDAECEHFAKLQQKARMKTMKPLRIAARVR